MKYIIAPIATALFLLSGCDNAQTSAPQQPTPEVGVVTLQSQPVPVVSQLTGRTTASLSAEVRPQVGGIIQKRLFTEGDMVKAGQALLPDRSLQLSRDLERSGGGAETGPGAGGLRLPEGPALRVAGQG